MKRTTKKEVLEAIVLFCGLCGPLTILSYVLAIQPCPKVVLPDRLYWSTIFVRRIILQMTRVPVHVMFER